MLPLMRVRWVIDAVSTSRTLPSANSATKRRAPVGESARPVGSEPVWRVPTTVGEAVLMFVTFTTVASARLATNAVVLSGARTTELGSLPVGTRARGERSEVLKIEIDPSCGFTITASWSSSVTATVEDFDGCLSTAAGPRKRDKRDVRIGVGPPPVGEAAFAADGPQVSYRKN